MSFTNDLDGHGQPLNRNYSFKRIDDRTVDELIGLCRGMAADEMVNLAEAKFLKSWLEANLSYTDDRLVNQLYRRVHEMLIDGILDQEEREELLTLLKMFTGDVSPTEVAANMTSLLPIDQPQPVVEFPTMTFCITGRFAYGPRRVCEEVIVERGGKIGKTVTLSTDYLVLGVISSRDWIHTSYGRKIEKAMDLREKEGRIAIISEDHWAETAFNMGE